MSFNINATHPASDTLVNGTHFEQGFGAWFSDSINQAANKVNDLATVSWTTITDSANSVSDTVTSTFSSVSDTVTSTINDYTANGTVLGDTYTTASATVADNSFFIRASGAAIGASAAVSSAVNLLQGRQNIQPAREFAKIAAGTGLVALSLYASAEDELTGLGNIALGAGLATALVKVATYAKDTFHIHMYKLKSREASPELQNVVQISTNS